jgi:hypothetical protein
MGLQQMGVASAVLSRGLDVARASKDDCWEAALCYQLAVSRVLGGDAPGGGSSGGGAPSGSGGGGGGGGTAAAKEGGGEGGEAAAAEAPAAEFDAAEVLRLQEEGDAAVAAVKGWWPAGWDDYRPEGEPDRTVLAEKLLPMVAERCGTSVAPGAGRLPALTGVLYVTRAPTTVAPGAVDTPGGEGVPEGDEEGEDDEEAGVPAVPQV